MYRPLLLLAALLYAPVAEATVITVGPGGNYTTIGAAVNHANLDRDPTHSYTISIASGVYANPNIHVTRSMTLDAVVDGGVVLLGSSDLPNQKALILTDGVGTSLTVDGLVFQGAHISNSLGGNGAGIRDQNSGVGSALNVTDSKFIGNQEGILTGGSGGKERIFLQHDKFLNNGNASKNTGQEHAIYINSAASVVIDSTSVCGQVGSGHNYKIRSLTSQISNSQSYEGVAGGGCSNPGNASRGIDIPNGGVFSMGNVDLYQGPYTGNSAMLEFGVEGLAYANNSATLTGVDFFNTRSSGTAIQWFGGSNPCTLNNVTFTGITTKQSPAGCTIPATGSTLATVATVATVVEAIPVPEPSTLLLLLGGLGWLALYRRWL